MAEPVDTDHIDIASHITAADPWPISLVDVRTNQTLAIWYPDGKITLNREDGTPAVTLTWNQLVDALTLHLRHLEDHTYPQTTPPAEPC